MDEKNKKIIYAIIAIIVIIILGYAIYCYSSSLVAKKIAREKKKLQKYYEQQFNQLIYRNDENAQCEDMGEQECNREEDQTEPSGVESDSASSHSGTIEHGQLSDIKILDDNFKRSGTAKRCRG